MTTRNILGAGGSGEGAARPEAESGDFSASGAGRPQDVVWNGRLRVAPDPEKDLTCCRLPLTDMGAAERWRVRHGADFRFCPELGWLAWDSRRWKLLSEEKDQVPAAVTWSIARTARAVRNEAALVAASGFPPVIGLSDKEWRELERWSEAHGTANRDDYLRGDEPEHGGDGSRRAWLEQLEPMDLLIGRPSKQELWSHKIAGFAKACEKAGTVAAAVKWIKGMPDIVVRPDELDADRMAINVLNGTLRLVKGNVKRSAEEVAAGKSVWRSEWKIRRDPHRREDLLTKLAPVKFSAAARCPEYDGFIARVQPDEHMRRFIHQWGGYSLTGDIGEHKLVFFHGGGRNGKGTWVEAVAEIAGDYAGSIGFESLADQQGQRRGDQATPDIARLPGVRMLRVAEPKKGVLLNDGLIKQFTGGDKVDARHLNKGFFTFLPSFKLTISGNNKPVVKDLSHGMWSRMQLVPWDVTIPEDEIDRQLGERLLANERSGILNRLIEGLLDWRRNGLIVPEQVRLATRKYRGDSDDVGRFLSAICLVSGDKDRVRTGAKFLHELYTAWAGNAGGATIGLKAFKLDLENKGFDQISSDGMKWRGLGVKPGVTLEDVQRGRWPADDDPGAEGGGSDLSGVEGPPGEGWEREESGQWEPDGDPPGWE